MIFTLEKLTDSIAGVLKMLYPDIPVYSNPSQQGTTVPCFFVFFMPVETENQIGRRFMRNIGIDVVYLVEKNDPDAYDRMTAAADVLDCTLEFVPYEKEKLRTFDREWKIDDGELHYQFAIKAMVSYADETPYMESADYEGGIKNGEDE